MRIDSTLMHHPVFVASKKRLKSIFLYLLILPFINQMELGDELNLASSRPLLLPAAEAVSLLHIGNPEPLPSPRHGQPLTGNWVFIRLPARERCSVFI